MWEMRKHDFKMIFPSLEYHNCIEILVKKVHQRLLNCECFCKLCEDKIAPFREKGYFLLLSFTTREGYHSSMRKLLWAGITRNKVSGTNF